jgi:hypothetical protein
VAGGMGGSGARAGRGCSRRQAAVGVPCLSPGARRGRGWVGVRQGLSSYTASLAAAAAACDLSSGKGDGLELFRSGRSRRSGVA